LKPLSSDNGALKKIWSNCQMTMER
jgi:hypothetical protein